MVSEDVCQPFATRSHKLGNVKRHPNKKSLYLPDLNETLTSLDRQLSLILKEEQRLFTIEKHTSKHYESITNF